MSGIVYNRSNCDLCGRCVEVCPFGAIHIIGGAVEISPECRMCLQCVEVCPLGALVPPQKGQSAEEAERLGPEGAATCAGVMIFAQYGDGRFDPVTYELMGKAIELSQKVHENVTCVVAGNGVKAHAAELLSYGVSQVLVYDHPGLEHFLADVYADVMEDAVRREKPGVVLIGATAIGRSLAPRLAVRLRTGLTADCTILDIRPNGDLVQTRPAFGGNIMATILTPDRRPQMATVRYKVMSPAQRVFEPEGRVVHVDVEATNLAATIRDKLQKAQVLSVSAVPKSESIADARIIVAVGRGLRSAADIPMIEELAARLGGVVGCSRPLVEKGWFPPSKQVGLSGRTVRPRLYLACGISGAVQHVAGMSVSETIVAINADKDAPIFKAAHYAVVGDLYEMIPALINAVS